MSSQISARLDTIALQGLIKKLVYK